MNRDFKIARKRSPVGHRIREGWCRIPAGFPHVDCEIVRDPDLPTDEQLAKTPRRRYVLSHLQETDRRRRQIEREQLWRWVKSWFRVVR